MYNTWRFRWCRWVMEWIWCGLVMGLVHVRWWQRIVDRSDGGGNGGALVMMMTSLAVPGTCDIKDG
ncbi:hypothetical protein Tco_0129440, partial [Tanacetum coccineum]